MNTQNVEKIVEVVTREVLRALAEQEAQQTPDGAYCTIEESDGILVKTCFDDVGHVISAGAERIASTLGQIPDDTDLAGMILKMFGTLRQQ
ncbi:MAG: hypothetical protein L3J16_04140 [Anaerolineales bacterium]|nr:hypothetical protein [Anaerolineales bacterium]